MPNICLASYARRGRRGGRHGGIALGVACIITGNAGNVLVLWRYWVFIAADCKVAIGLQRLIVGEAGGCLALDILAVALRRRRVVDAILELEQGPSRRRAVGAVSISHGLGRSRLRQCMGVQVRCVERQKRLWCKSCFDVVAV